VTGMLIHLVPPTTIEKQKSLPSPAVENDFRYILTSAGFDNMCKFSLLLGEIVKPIDSNW
jgi:hypothetical protein